VFLQELAKREEEIKNGRLKTILFIRVEEKATDGDEDEQGEMSSTRKTASPGKAKKKDIKKEQATEKKKEISGYIDLAQRFQAEDFRPYFTGEKRLLPRNGDLSYYNWKAQNPTVSDSRNFRVIANSKAGLLFRNKLDRKDIDVNPDLYQNEKKVDASTNTKRVDIEDPMYKQIVFFDHWTRKGMF